MRTIYTLNEAADIVELFENLLDEHNIRIPSPEDDERGDDNEAKIYGSVYGDLLYSVEDALLDIIERSRYSDIVPREFG